MKIKPKKKEKIENAAVKKNEGFANFKHKQTIKINSRSIFKRFLTTAAKDK